MHPQRRVLLTTTSVLDGWEVQEYLGPVSAQFVIGTGLLTEFLSGWTDFFGMHSGAYQKKLDRINSEALDQVSERARRLGADAVIGLRVDHDEVSGGGKSMLMVTASGTAVKATPPRPPASPPSGLSGLPITAEEMRSRRRRNAIVRSCLDGKMRWNDEDTWQFIVNEQMAEVSDTFLSHVEKTLANGYSDDMKKASHQFQEFFLSLAHDEAVDSLYACIRRSPKLFGLAVEVVKVSDGLSVEKVGSFLQSDDDEVARRSLRFLEAEQVSYSEADVHALSDLIDLVDARFQPAAVTESKGLLGQKRKWTCVCEREEDESSEQCRFCHRDRLGFAPNSVTPERAKRILLSRIEVLKRHFPNDADRNRDHGA